MKRCSETQRKTLETDIKMKLTIDGNGKSDITTGIGFLDHMLSLFAKHGNFDLVVKADGDLFIDDHHTVEDIGIVFGQCFKKAIGDKRGINRYGFFILPMDETLTTVAFDFAGRYAFNLESKFNREKVGDLSTEVIYDFWNAFAQNAEVNLIIKSEFGRNDHHIIEGIFKASARAIKMACSIDQENTSKIPSTKGCL